MKSKRILRATIFVSLGLASASLAWTAGAARDVGSGAADIGKGTLKGAGSVAKGTGKGAVDLVTLHPVTAAGSVGKGAVGAGKDITVGTAKGSGKIARGVGKAFKHVL
jgi:hypothetical protein